MSALTYHVISTLHDPYLEPFLDRFQDDFPANEKIHVSTFLRALKKKEQGADSDFTLLCACESEGGALLGIACFDIEASDVGKRDAVLWYFAVDPARRNQKIGSQFYQDIVQQFRERCPSLRFLLYEVERPDQAYTPADAEQAERRIAFYRRNGGLVCTNVVYRQQVRNEPELMMYLMVHPFDEVDREPAAMLDAVNRVFGDSIEPVETLIAE